MSEKKDLTVEAQNYSLKHKLKNFTGKGIQRSVSELGSSKYKERMDTLREADDEMRSTAVLFKDYLRSAEKAFKDNRYLDVAHWCAMVNDGVKLMMKDAKSVVDLRDAEIAEYYTRHEDANPESNYFSADDGLVSTAGLMNRLFGNSIEKLYWKKIRESKLAVQALVSRTEKLIAITYSSLDRMGNARAQGNIGSWIEDLQRIGKAQGEFQVFAKGIYDKHLKQLADIVKANKPVSAPEETSMPSQNSPKSIPENDKAEEADELVEEEPVFDLINKKDLTKNEPIKEEKFDKGRPALNDPRNVKKDNDEELKQWEKVQEFLKGNKPEIKEEPKVETKAVESEVIAPVEEAKTEVAKTPEVIKAPEIAAPKAIEPNVPKVVQPPKPIEQPKNVLLPTQIENAVKNIQPSVVAPQVPKAPEQATLETAPKRGRGRPRKYPLPEGQVQKTNLSSAVQKPESVQAPIDNPFSTAPAVTAPSVSKAPVKEESVHVDIKGKGKTKAPPPEKDYMPWLNDMRRTLGKDPISSAINAPKTVDEKKRTLVLIPKNKPDNLEEIKADLESSLGHPVIFVTKDNGAAEAERLAKKGYELNAMIYDDAVKKIKESAGPAKDPLKLLDDPEFLKTLPRLGNGDFNKNKLLFDDDTTLQGGKIVSVPSKFPDFANLSPEMRKAVVNKLLELEKDPKNIIIPVKKEKDDKSVDEKIPKEEKSPEVPEVNIPEETKSLDEDIANEPDEENVKPLSEEEENIIIYEHAGLLEKLLKKKIEQVNKSDIFNLLENPAYIKSLPRNKDKSFNINLISKFPEFKIMQNAGMSKKYISVLNNKEALEKRTKAAANVEDILIKRSHIAFFNELKKVASIQDVGLMAALMCKYSEEIEEIDPQMSIQLLEQAEKLLA